MKKIILLILLFSLSSLFIYSKERFIFLDFKKSEITEVSFNDFQQITNYKQQGLNLSIYLFNKSNSVGIFLEESVLFPYSGTINLNNEIANIQDFDLKKTFSLSLKWGPSSKFTINNRINILNGIGLNLKCLIIENYSNGYLGLGGENILSYKILGNIRLNTGLSYSYNFLNFIPDKNVTLINNISYSFLIGVGMDIE